MLADMLQALCLPVHSFRERGYFSREVNTGNGVLIAKEDLVRPVQLMQRSSFWLPPAQTKICNWRPPPDGHLSFHKDNHVWLSRLQPRRKWGVRRSYTMSATGMIRMSRKPIPYEPTMIDRIAGIKLVNSGHDTMRSFQTDGPGLIKGF